MSILKFIAEEYKEQIDLSVFNGIDKLPHFNPDLDNEHLPKSVKDFRNQIESADGVIICTPEYVFSLPGSLKNAIEWNVSTTLFSNKPLAIIVASASGEKAFESLDLIMTTIEANMSDHAKLLIRGAKGKIGKDEIISDKDTLHSIDLLIKSLIESIEVNLT